MSPSVVLQLKSHKNKEDNDMKIKKFELSDTMVKTITARDGRKVTLHRIVMTDEYVDALEAEGKFVYFPEGGWVESEKNLSQNGYCWIEYDSMVYENARIRGNATIDGSRVYGNAMIKGDVELVGSTVYDNAVISGSREVSDSIIYGNARISGRNVVDGIKIFENAAISRNAVVHGDYSKLHGNIRITGNTYLSGKFDLSADVEISGGTWEIHAKPNTIKSLPLQINKKGE